jgi:hypothetical protein
MTTLALAPRRVRPSHEELATRLHRASVGKHADAYADIDWDAPAHRIEPEDPRFVLQPSEGLGRTAWYRALAPELRARIGLHVALAQLRLGMDFESILCRGLLELAFQREPGSADLRYAYQEVIEEAQHSLMFQEFIARAGLPVRGLGGLERVLSRRIPRLARSFPELFFLHVLGGEAPIDHVQRRELARKDETHPLLRTIMRIHVTEEARHISFARSYLRERVPQLGWWKRQRLEVHAPFVLRVMVGEMIVPPTWLLDLYDVPRETRRELRSCPYALANIIEGLGPIRSILSETGIVAPRNLPLWRALGLASAGAPPALPARASASS